MGVVLATEELSGLTLPPSHVSRVVDKFVERVWGLHYWQVLWVVPSALLWNVHLWTPDTISNYCRQSKYRPFVAHGRRVAAQTCAGLLGERAEDLVEGDFA